MHIQKYLNEFFNIRKYINIIILNDKIFWIIIIEKNLTIKW